MRSDRNDARAVSPICASVSQRRSADKCAGEKDHDDEDEEDDDELDDEGDADDVNDEMDGCSASKSCANGATHARVAGDIESASSACDTLEVCRKSEKQTMTQMHARQILQSEKIQVRKFNQNPVRGEINAQC